ncbi:MAG: aminotransferase class I/II-fold pyridoxal phosphate-dependent enzyme [Candidatus Lokiarchaeota archaeon]|nr:aminotransferase class I/II-fold pyridoxal phosphate-dependent enzyme [Candidatus Lokiarchaeota archaeon]
MKYADRMERLGTETAFAVLSQIQDFPPERREHVISFAIGEPDFDTPEHIKQAAIESINNNRTHYTPSAGIPELREAIAEYVSKQKNLNITSENVCVLPSAKFIINLSIATCTDPGDEIIYPNPGYPIYESQIRVFGCTPIAAPLIEEEEWGFDIDRLRNLMNDRTKMIILNNPNNPCGSVLSNRQLEALRELALQHDLWVLSDEIYSNLVYDNLTFHSIAELPDMQERTIILDGYSKFFAMTGWRLGYAISNPQLIDYFARWATNTISCTATFVQDAGVAAMKESMDPSWAMVRQFEERRNLICERLNDIEGISVTPPKGAFYVFANVTEACEKKGFKDSLQFQERLLDEQDVAVLARNFFGHKDPDERQEYIRFSYCVSTEDIKEGISRIKTFVEG